MPEKNAKAADCNVIPQTPKGAYAEHIFSDSHKILENRKVPFRDLGAPLHHEQ